MKKYRLLKDLPTFKAGEIFKLKGGNLYYYPAENGTENAHWSDRIMAYHHKTLENNKPVKCLDTGEIFISASEAARQKGCSQSNITKAILGERNKAGGLRWSYYFGGEE